MKSEFTDARATKKKSPKQKSIHYIDKEQFWLAMKDYKDVVIANEKIGKQKPIIPKFIAECFIKITERLSLMPNFRGYTFLEEMKGDGIENCLLYIDSFDPYNYKNPFDYFSLTVYRAFLRRIASEKKELYIKYKSTQNYGLFNDMSLVEEGMGQPVETYDNINTFVEEYESKLAAKKMAKKEEKITKKKTKGLENFTEET